jgi:hypothetical protein
MFPSRRSAGSGGDGRQGRGRANNTWKPFFATDDIERTLKLAPAHRATVDLPAMAIDDLGSQAVISDPAGAVTGIWQPGSGAELAFATQFRVPLSVDDLLDPPGGRHRPASGECWLTSGQLYR